MDQHRVWGPWVPFPVQTLSLLTLGFQTPLGEAEEPMGTMETEMGGPRELGFLAVPLRPLPCACSGTRGAPHPLRKLGTTRVRFVGRGPYPGSDAWSAWPSRPWDPDRAPVCCAAELFRISASEADCG